ncbi:helix-turn-helix domain-containing protein [Maritalea sp. S77]|jgi:transcriptional regulator with XRE-family HTH domain|uniref:helix-turn-helix domain-containing protein n=1 Tax=Maritalea sp. S77 TaxID=3415125 RepID=UPI003C7E8A89
MKKLSDRLRERAQQLNISNAEAARRIGLEERRYSYYVAGQREPDLATLCRIADRLGTTPNWLLGFDTMSAASDEKKMNIARIENALNSLGEDQLRLLADQIEALSSFSGR